MAVYFQNTLMRTSHFVKISDRYSSIQSIWRGKKRGKIAVKEIGGLQFAPTDAEQVGKLYSVADWQKLNVVSPVQLPHELSTLSKTSKAVGVGEAVILEWAMFNRLDAYWVGGTFFANLAQAKQVAALDAAR